MLGLWEIFGLDKLQIFTATEDFGSRTLPDNILLIVDWGTLAPFAIASSVYPALNKARSISLISIKSPPP